jgi:hypothetical protein
VNPARLRRPEAADREKRWKGPQRRQKPVEARRSRVGGAIEAVNLDEAFAARLDTPEWAIDYRKLKTSEEFSTVPRWPFEEAPLV